MKKEVLDTFNEGLLKEVKRPLEEIICSASERSIRQSSVAKDKNIEL